MKLKYFLTHQLEDLFLDLTKVLVEESRKLEHVDGFFRSKDFGELGVGDDVPLVLRILEIVLLDVFPSFFNHFRT